MASNNLPRRTFLTGTAATAATVAVAGAANAVSDKGEQASQFADAKKATGAANLPAWKEPEYAAFMHGVASGDPLTDRVIIWTRVTVSEDAMPGSQKGDEVEVKWEVATDEGFGSIVKDGTEKANKDRDHTVKVDVDGLQPGTKYYYRFSWDGNTSPVGTTMTAHAKGADLSELKIAVASCANWESGYFSAYDGMAAQAKAGGIDLVCFLGDYIYEYANGEYIGKSGVNRPHLPDHEIIEIKDYRERYGRYRTDKALQDAHGAVPWVCVWDDHETADNSWRLGAFNHTVNDYKYKSRTYKADVVSWGERMWAGHRAYFEWMPVRETGQQVAAEAYQNNDKVSEKEEPVIYRTLEFGDLVKLIVLDLRSYRDVVLGEALDETGENLTIDNKYRTMLGHDQYRWAKEQIETSDAKWNVMGNSVMIAPFEIIRLPETDKANKAANQAIAGFANQLGVTETGESLGLDGKNTGTVKSQEDGTDKALGGVVGNTDQWDGYRADRTRMLDMVHQKRAQGTNTLFITGDIHSEWANSLYHKGEEIACELVTTSISAPNLDEVLTGVLGTYVPENGRISHLVEAAIRSINPWVNHMDFDSHGYAVATVKPDEVKMDFYRVTNVEDPKAKTYLGTSRTWRPAQAEQNKQLGKKISGFSDPNKPQNGLSSGSSSR